MDLHSKIVGVVKEIKAISFKVILIYLLDNSREIEISRERLPQVYVLCTYVEFIKDPLLRCYRDIFPPISQFSSFKRQLKHLHKYSKALKFTQIKSKSALEFV